MLVFMGEARHDGLAVPGRVVLAHEPPFRIGSLSVDPPTRQVESGSRRETLEPRVMQVLVVLARANGGIVTRDDLVAQCWDGRIVGDDSINRAISRIRHVASDIGDRQFSVETIAKVGYRLVTAETKQADSTPPARTDRRKLVFGGVAAAAVAAAGGAGAWRTLRGEPGPPREARLLYDRAIGLRSTGFPQDDRQAIAYLREAVRVAPHYGEAWGALAAVYSNAIASEAPERVEGFAELRDEAIRQAERYDPGNADAAAAQLPLDYFGRWAEAERAYRDLIDRHSAHAGVNSLLGTLLMDVGRWSDAVGVLTTARARNALAPITRYKLAVSLWGAGRISEAEREIDDALKKWPEHGAIWQTKVKLLALTGRARAALAIANEPGSRPLDEAGEQIGTRRLVLTALASGVGDDVSRAVDALLSQVRTEPLNALPNALYCVALGLSELALEMIEGVFLGIGAWAALHPKDSTASLVTHPLFQPHARSLWASPRFAALVERIGLERYWNMTGKVPDFRRSR